MCIYKYFQNEVDYLCLVLIPQSEVGEPQGLEYLAAPLKQEVDC